MKKIVLLVLVVAAACGGFLLMRRHQANTLLEKVEKEFETKRGPGMIDDLREIYSKGSAAAKGRCERMLVSLSVPDEVGVWKITGVKKTLEDSSGSKNSVKASPTEGVVLTAVHAVWGDQTQMGVMESAAWAKFVLANFSGKPLAVDRNDFLIHADERVFAYNKLGAEEGGVKATIGAGKGLAGACFFHEVGQPPTVLEFNNGSLLVRAKVGALDRINNYKRDVGEWPGAESLKAFPVRTSFSKQIISKDEAAKHKPADPSDGGGTDDADKGGERDADKTKEEPKKKKRPRRRRKS